MSFHYFFLLSPLLLSQLRINSLSWLSLRTVFLNICCITKLTTHKTITMNTVTTILPISKPPPNPSPSILLLQSRPDYIHFPPLSISPFAPLFPLPSVYLFIKLLEFFPLLPSTLHFLIKNDVILCRTITNELTVVSD